MRVWGCAAVLIIGALALAGCGGGDSGGGDSELSAQELEQTIREEYDQRARGDIALTELACEDAEAEVGAQIECRARNNRNIDLEIGGEVTAVDDKASYTWRVGRAFAPGVFYERGARRILEENQGLDVDAVSCPARIELVVDAEISCDVTVGGRVVPSILTITDLEGGFKIRSA